MKVTTGILMDLIDRIAPFSLAEDWDNSGLQAGDLSWPVKKVMVALDVSMAVMDAAEQWHADLVLTHHPLMFHAVKCIDFNSMPGNIIARAALGKISIISAHTNFDKADNGLNDFFARMIGLKNISALCTGTSCMETSNMDACKTEPPLSGRYQCPDPGIGRKGEIDAPVPLYLFARQIKKKLCVESVRMTGPKDLLIKTVAVCTGSGGSLLNDFFRSCADVFVTGDIKYHEARDVEQAGLGLIDVGHFQSEHIAVGLLAEKLEFHAKNAGIDIEVRGFNREEDPFRII